MKEIEIYVLEPEDLEPLGPVVYFGGEKVHDLDEATSEPEVQDQGPS